MTYSYELRDTLIKVDDVHAMRGGSLVLRDIAVEIKDIVRPDVADRGQVIGVLGPSGIRIVETRHDAAQALEQDIVARMDDMLRAYLRSQRSEARLYRTTPAGVRRANVRRSR